MHEKLQNAKGYVSNAAISHAGNVQKLEDQAHRKQKSGKREKEMTEKPKLLLHVCCATCAAYVLELLQKDYEVTAYYYNPNIFPQKEYETRFSEVQAYCAANDIPFIEEAPDQSTWFEKTRGHEADPERGPRCTICYQMRMQKTAEYAKLHGFEIFGTDLSISPHKDAKRLNAIGRGLEALYGVKHLEADFKKRDGFKKAMAISRKNNFYRQEYCGCIYSMQAREEQKERELAS